METAVKVKFAILEEHQKRPGEYGYNSIATRYFETEGEFFEAWGESLPSGLPNAVEEPGDYKIHKSFGTLYIDDDGVPVACVSLEECPVAEAQSAARRR